LVKNARGRGAVTERQRLAGMVDSRLIEPLLLWQSRDKINPDMRE
jgi:hypothetical protein